jgi:hypothetical protein
VDPQVPKKRLGDRDRLKPEGTNKKQRMKRGGIPVKGCRPFFAHKKGALT